MKSILCVLSVIAVASAAPSGVALSPITYIAGAPAISHQSQVRIHNSAVLASPVIAAAAYPVAAQTYVAAPAPAVLAPQATLVAAAPLSLPVTKTVVAAAPAPAAVLTGASSATSIDDGSLTGQADIKTQAQAGRIVVDNAHGERIVIDGPLTAARVVAPPAPATVISAPSTATLTTGTAYAVNAVLLEDGLHK